MTVAHPPSSMIRHAPSTPRMVTSYFVALPSTCCLNVLATEKLTFLRAGILISSPVLTLFTMVSTSASSRSPICLRLTPLLSASFVTSCAFVIPSVLPRRGAHLMAAAPRVSRKGPCTLEHYAPRSTGARHVSRGPSPSHGVRAPGAAGCGRAPAPKTAFTWHHASLRPASTFGACTAASSRGIALAFRSGPTREADVQSPNSTEGVRDLLDRILSSYEEMDRRFAPAGGIGSLLNLYEQVRRELDRVSYEELDRMTREIKTVIEALLKMDYELRKVHNLKLVFDARPVGSATE